MYPLNIAGITGASNGNFVFDKDTNEQTMRQFVDELPPQITVGFYDKNYPSPSDPGAFVLFKRVKDQFIMQRANHGWSSKWEPITVESLVRYLSECSNYNMDLDGHKGIYFQLHPPTQKKRRK
jgi:hypothetical protein